MRVSFVIAFALVALVAASGCVGRGVKDVNETTEYEYYNKTLDNSTNGSQISVSNDFTFKINGDGVFWLKANDTVGFDVVFNNFADDEEAHMFVAKVFPSAADFDVMAAYQCLHFTTCEPLLTRMRVMMEQPDNSTLVSYGYVDLYSIKIRIPDGTPAGTYMYNAVACRDMKFGDCLENTTNFGSNVPITLHVLNAG
ncbi:MAG: hypothetical protein NTU57_02355 [Candidatus Aenigmarchaeota archaeon]|nr:hypothetical protein [Candidatus Aenigmarchaeota archaeon]